MLDLKLIEDTIQELENEPTSFENCNLLASLYICREQNKNRNMSVIEVSNDTYHLEIDDILPAYKNYIDTKRRYQQFEVVDSMLIYAMDNLCREIKEFIADLYYNTESEAERVLLTKLINEDLRSAI